MTTIKNSTNDIKENIEAIPRSRGITMTSTEPRSSGHLQPNDTLNWTTGQTSTQKLTIPTLEKEDQANAIM